MTLQEIEKYLKSTFLCENTSATTESKEPTLTIDLMKIMEDLLKNKIEIKSSQYIDIDKYYIVDHEELRKTMPFYEDMGTLIICHPDNELRLREILSAVP